MQIGILQTGASPDALRGEHGDYPDFFERLLQGRGLAFRRFHVEAMEFPASVQECDGWLITGSRHGAYEDHPFIKPLEDFIRRAYDERVPMVGICFGHQIMADALGADLGQRLQSPGSAHATAPAAAASRRVGSGTSASSRSSSARLWP